MFSVVQYCISTPSDQVHDILIINKDTICLKSFPLEDLGFAKRPFNYGGYDFPGTHCWRGYKATWQVIDNKLFLTTLAKADDSGEEADIIKFFAENNYVPTLINGLVFADWFTMDLRSFPRDYKFLGCVWKSRRPEKCKALLKFDRGVMKSNRYKSKQPTRTERLHTV